MESIHARIRRLRKEKSATQEELAKAAGVSYQTVQEWERVDGTAPARKRQGAVAAFLGVTVQELLVGAPEGANAPLRGKMKRIAEQLEWLTKEQQEELLDDLDSKATANRIIAREMRGKLNPASDKRVEQAIRSKGKASGKR